MVLNKKYKGNTLPEVLIAIVIISFTSALGITIYINIQENTQPFLKLKANEIANHYLIESEQTHDYFDKSFKEEEFTVKKTITTSDKYPDCVLVKISVSSKPEKKICEIQKLIHAN
jgi:prepilin-type N-terminal cleavage/methylation domain-containing protein